MSKSIYRGWRDLPSDVQVQDRADEGAIDDSPASPPVHLRRSQPAAVLRDLNILFNCYLGMHDAFDRSRK